MYISLFRYNLPLEKDRALQLKSAKDDLCQVWLKLAQGF